MKSNDAAIRVLVVDDNPAIYEDFKKILAGNNLVSDEMQEDELLLFKDPNSQIFESQKYQLNYADQGQKAVDMVRKSLEQNQPYAVIYVDIRMPPGWDGIKTIGKIWELDSEVQIVICTAYSDYSWEDILNKFGQTDQLLILKKPFDNIEVRQLTVALAKKWNLAKEVKQQLQTLQEKVDEQTTKLKESYSLLKATFDATADGILVVNMQSVIVDYNAKFTQLWNIPLNLLDDGVFEKILPFFENELLYPAIFIRRLEEYKKFNEQESFDILELKNGKVFECYSNPQYLNKQIIGRVWDFRDITENKQMEEQLTYQASHDVLTGLFNRAFLYEQIEKNIVEVVPKKSQLAILFFDLDRFKLINDTLGHSVGDKLLKAVAGRMKQSAKATDTVARLGGDEFVILAKDVNSHQEIIDLIKRFLMVISKPFNISENIFNITASIGISIYPKDGATPDVLLKNADSAMYRAKELGRNNFQFFDMSMNVVNSIQLELGNRLPEALKNHEFVLFYHPLANITDKKIIGVEALLRWQHPERGLINPLEFISIAENTGIIVQIGEWVLRTACKQLKKWHEQGHSDLWISVNLSVVQLKRPNFVSLVVEALQDAKLEAKYLCLEITENLLLENIEQARGVLTELKKLGVAIAVDDFGMGYSSLNYISQFPIDMLKIDKSFVRDVVNDPNDAAVVLAIINMAKSLHMKVLAEGVETTSQLKFLRNNKCNEIQGFLISEPVDAAVFSSILDADKKIK